MPTLAKIARKVMGLPELDASTAARKGNRRHTPHRDSPSPVNPWEAAGQRIAAQQRKAPLAPRTPANRSAPETPWVIREENSGKVFARRFGRGLAWAVLVLAAVTGVRAWIAPTQQPAPAPATNPTTARDYPDAQARAVAARFTRAYLAWDEDHPQDRAQLLAAVLPAGADTAMGWDGDGTQTVTAVQPGAVHEQHNDRARVRVEALVEAPEGDEKPETRWVALDVPVIATSGRIVVTGQPGIVGLPHSGPTVPESTLEETDAELTQRTEDTVTRFFTAYAAGDAGAVTAPGATVPPLPDGIDFEDVTAWSVDQGAGSDRTGTARVTWTMAGATIEQTYRVQLTRVSSAEAQRWQVADVLGGTA